MDRLNKDEGSGGEKDEEDFANIDVSKETKDNAEEVSVESQTTLKRKLEQTAHIPTSNAEQYDTLPAWVAGTSPAKFVSLDELMEMSKAMENMALVHEMAVNPKFAIPETSYNPIEKAVKDCVHKIFWDNMKEDLKKQPPDYTNAFSTLMDVRKIILDLLTPQHVRLRMEIESQLDRKLLEQQLNNNCLDWVRLSEYLISLLGRLCAPIRDGMVEKLKEKTDVVDILRGVCELLEYMKIDMANFEVKQNRAYIEDYSAVYERNEFFKLLKNDPTLEESVSDWLKGHIDSVNLASTTSDVSEPLVKRRFEELNNSEVGAIISSAYMQLLEWNENQTYPSTMLVDHYRLEQLSSKYQQLIVCTSSVLVTCVSIGQNIVDTVEFKQKLKDELIAITGDLKRESIHDTLEAVYLHCDKRAREVYENNESKAIWTEEKSKNLKSQIMSLENEKNPVRQLLRHRIQNFILSLLKCEQQSSKQQLPAGLSMVREELNALTATFIRLVTHNRNVFGVYYGGLIKKIMSV